MAKTKDVPASDKIDVTMKFMSTGCIAITLEGTPEQIEGVLTTEFGNRIADTLESGGFEKVTKN